MLGSQIATDATKSQARHWNSPIDGFDINPKTQGTQHKVVEANHCVNLLSDNHIRPELCISSGRGWRQSIRREGQCRLISLYEDLFGVAAGGTYG